ncbi:MAG: C-terminal binding protein [Spirochaetales bacterium]|nr:C-terminal binding protein [Spirochaetales bacterium]
MSHTIVYTDYYYDSVQAEFDLLSTLPDVRIVDLTEVKKGGITAPEELVEHVADADALVTQFAVINADVMDAMPNCRIIARHAIGVDTIDLTAARERGIVVSNVPDYCIEEVSDTAMAHILNGVRRIGEADRLLRAGEWAYSKIMPLSRFSEMTVGLLAFGAIARRVAEKLRGFRVKVLAYDAYAKPTPEFDWVEFVPLDRLLAEADVISIHVPLNDETHHMVNEKVFEAMKPGVVLVNTSRGGVIDQAALADAIARGVVRHAGLDVLEEPDAEYAESPVLASEQVTVSPHLGWYSEQSIEDLKMKTARNVAEMLTNGKPLYTVH